MSSPSRRDRRRRLMAVAASQAGYFTAAQALEVGYSYAAQSYHRLHDNWLRTDRGIYRLPAWPPAPHEDLVRWTLWSRGRGVVSHETALSVHELGDVNPERVHLTVPPRFRASAEGVILHRAVLKPSERQAREGFSVTTALRSLMDVAAGPLDLDQLATAVSEALDRGLVTARQLREQADAEGAHAAFRIERSLVLVNGSVGSGNPP